MICKLYFMHCVTGENQPLFFCAMKLLQMPKMIKFWHNTDSHSVDNIEKILHRNIKIWQHYYGEL